MENSDLDYFRELLVDWRQELLQRADGAVQRLTDMEETPPDPADRATYDEERTYLIRIRDRESRLIRKINEALERIEGGSFGICDKCEEDIGIGRLKARPVASLCIRCKTETEALEKVGI